MKLMKIVGVIVIALVVLVVILKSRKPSGPVLSYGNFDETGPPLSAEDVVAECRNAGLSTIADQLNKAILPCFYLVSASHDETTTPYRTQLGGLPDLPDPSLWPKHRGKSLSFIAQINLSEVANASIKSALPMTGMLYFFYDAEQSTWGFNPEDKGSWRVLYIASVPDTPTEVSFPDDVPEHARYSKKLLKPSSGKSIPDPMELVWNSGLPEKQQDLVLDFYGRYSEQGPPKHQLHGHPMPIQGDMQLECQLVSPGLSCGDSTGYNDPRAEALKAGASRWQLLLQIDTDDDSGMMWGDCGRLYFWITEDDLKEKRFENTWMILQCY